MYKIHSTYYSDIQTYLKISVECPLVKERRMEKTLLLYNSVTHFRGLRIPSSQHG